MIHPPFDVLTEEEVSVAQLSDPEISTVIAWFDNGSLVRPPEATLAGASRNLRRFAAELDQFVLHAKVLWYKSLDHEHISLRLVAPPSLQELAVASVHLLPGSSHLGIGKTLQHCKDRFYWYGLDKFVNTFIQGCEVCQRTSKRTSSGTAMLQNMQTGYCFEHPVSSIKPSLGKPLTVHFNRLKKCHRFKSMPPGRPPDSESPSSDSLSSPNLVFVDDDYTPLQPAPLAPRRVQPQRTRQLPGHLRQFNVLLPPQR